MHGNLNSIVSTISLILE